MSGENKEIEETNRKNAESVAIEFLKAYKAKPVEEPDVVWLDKQFQKYPDIWASEGERTSTATTIVESIAQYDQAKRELDLTLAAGHSREKFLQDTLDRSMAGAGTVQVGRYATSIDQAIAKANEDMANRVYCHNPDGSIDFGRINQNPHLDGLIAESHHAGTFNIDAAAKESSLHAEALESNAKNSVDVVIKDADGHILKKYQLKYGKNAEATEQLFDQGDYRGQQKVVPEDQVEQIPGAKDHIEADGVKSEGLSKEQAKQKQEEIQEKGEAPEYDWANAGTGDVCRAIGKKAMIAGIFAIGFQAARILGRRAWNAITGKENPTAQEDLKEFVESAVKSGAGASVTVALTGATVVAVKKGWLGTLLKGAKSNVIANSVCIAVENVKILWKLGTGEITGEEALDMAGNANCALAGSLILGAKGASLGSAVGAVFGPPGAVIGGVVGGVIGGIAGSVVGEAIYNGAKAVCSAIENVGRKIGRAVSNIARALFCWC